MLYDTCKYYMCQSIVNMYTPMPLIPAAQTPTHLAPSRDDEIARRCGHGAGTERDGIQVGRDVAEREGLVRNFNSATLDSP